MGWIRALIKDQHFFLFRNKRGNRMKLKVNQPILIEDFEAPR